MNIKKIIKISISALMIFGVVYLADIKTLSTTLLSIPTSSVALLIGLYSIGQFISALKWWIIARSAGVNCSFGVALKSYYIGMYLNCFALGTVGGDLARGILIADGKPVKTEGVTSVFVDRIHGLAVLAGIASLSTLIIGQTSIDPLYAYGLGLISLSILAAWLVGPPLFIKMFSIDNRFRPKIEKLLRTVPRSYSLVGLITLISAFFHFFQIGMHLVMAQAVGVQLGWAEVLTSVPFVNILSSLPVSWQGLGVRETGYIFFLGKLITPEQGIAFGAMWIVAVTITSAVGGVIAVLSGDLKLLNRQLNQDNPQKVVG